MSTFVDKMLRSGQLQTHIKDTLVPTYRQRYYALMAATKTHLIPLGVTVESNFTATATAGGFFTYLHLPDDLPAAKIVAGVALKQQKLRVAFGHMFTVTGDEGSISRAEAKGGFARCIRLCWAWHEETELRRGIERLAAAIMDIRGMMQRGDDLESHANIGIR